MTSLRISIESGDSDRVVRKTKEELQGLGAQARSTEVDVRSLSSTPVTLDSSQVPAAVSQVDDATRAVRELDEARRDLDVSGGLNERAFGAGVFGSEFEDAERSVSSFTAAESRAVRTTDDLSKAVLDLGPEAESALGGISAKMDEVADSAERATNAIPSLFDDDPDFGPGGRFENLFDDVPGASGGGPASGSSEGVAGAANSVALYRRSLVQLGTAIVGLQGVRSVIRDLAAFDDQIANAALSTGLAGAGVGQLRADVASLSTVIPQTTTDLVRFATAAGRLGIESPEGIRQFVQEIGELSSISPGVGGGPLRIGQQVGRFLTLVSEGPSKVSALSDSVAVLQNEFTATGEEIFRASFELSRTNAGFTRNSADALGLGAAMASLNVSGNEVAETMLKITNAVSSGGPRLQILADVVGLSGDAFRDAFQTDSADLFIRVLEGIADRGVDASIVMDQLGFSGVQQARALTPLIRNTELLRRGVDSSRRAQEEGTAASTAFAARQETLGSAISRVKSVVLAAAAANSGFVGGLASSVGFVADVSREMLGLADASSEVGARAELVAEALQVSLIAGAGSVVILRLAAAYTSLTSTILVQITTTNAATGALVNQQVALTGMTAAVARARFAMASFATSPLGIALAAGAATAAIIAMNRSLNDVDTTEAGTELDDLGARMDRLDRAASGLAEARAVIVNAQLTGDAEGRLDGLRQRLRELRGASVAISGEVLIAVEGLEPEFQEAIRNATSEPLSAADLQTRTQAAIASAVRGVEIPGIEPEQAQALRDSVARALSGAAIPTGKLQALRVEDLFPDVDAASFLLSASVEEAARTALADAQEVFARGADLRVEVPGVSFGTAADLFPESFRKGLVEQVDLVFGKDVGQRADAVLKAAIQGVQIPGIDDDQSERVSSSIRAAIDIVSGRGDVGFDALEQSLENVGLEADQARQLLQSAIDVADGEINADGIRVLSLVLQEANVGAVGVKDALDAVGRAIDSTETEIKAPQFREPSDQPSKFFEDESKRINEAVRDAELSIGRLTIIGDTLAPTVGPDETVVPAFDPVELRGFEARREALVQERLEYEELLQQRLRSDQLSESITVGEAARLRGLRDELLFVEDATLQFAESQRILGVEQELVSRNVGLLDEGLRLMGLTARGDVTQAFEVLRRQVELVRIQAEQEIELRIGEGATGQEVAALRDVADAQREIVLRGLEVQETLESSRREINNLASASQSFASGATDALLGLQDPLEALRSFLTDIARLFIEPRLQAGFIQAFGGDDLIRTAAAQQAGVEDLLPSRPPVDIPQVSTDLGGVEVAPLDFASIQRAAEAASPTLVRFTEFTSTATLGLESVAAASQLASDALLSVAASQGGQQVSEASAAAAAAGAGIGPAVEGVGAVDGGDVPLIHDVSLPLEALAPAARGAASGLEALPPATVSTVTELAEMVPASQFTAAGLSTVQIAALEAQAGMVIAGQAAIEFALKLVAAGNLATTGATTDLFGAALSTAGGGIGAAELELGGVVERGRLQAFANGGLPTVADMEGSVIKSPTLALIGEGDDHEAIMPLSDSGGVRAIGGDGFDSVPLARDGSGKMAVDLSGVVAFADGGSTKDKRVRGYGFGGVPEVAVHSFQFGGVPRIDPVELAILASAARPPQDGGGARSNRGGSRGDVVDNSRAHTLNFNAIYNIRGGQSPTETGMKFTVRQLRRNVRDVLR